MNHQHPPGGEQGDEGQGHADDPAVGRLLVIQAGGVDQAADKQSPANPMQSSANIPVNNMGIVLFSSVVAWLFFKEK